MKIFRPIPILTLLLLMVFSAAAQPPYEGIPPRPDPPRLVNDFSGTLSSNDVARLERKLVAFNDTTSTQITVVLVKDFAGYDKAQFADLLGEQWGVGQKGKDNGIVVLVKPKAAGGRGETFIAPGYGLQGAVPDAVAKRIVEEEMIPEFSNNNYYGGLDRGTNVLMKLTAGEYSADDYMKRSGGGGGLGAFAGLIIFIIIIAWLLSRGRGMRHYSGRSSSLPFWTALFLANQMGNSSRGKWGDFKSGGGSFGGGGGFGGGGFGGFGGGSFGGGGAGGSW